MALFKRKGCRRDILRKTFAKVRECEIDSRKRKVGAGKQTVDDIEPEKEDLLTDDEEEEEDETAVPNKKDTSFGGRKPHLLVSGDAVKKPVSLTGKTPIVRIVGNVSRRIVREDLRTFARA